MFQSLLFKFLKFIFSDQANFNTKPNISYYKQLMSQLIFGYWKVRGLGQYIRLLLAYSGLDFKEVQYDNREKWFSQDKTNLGFDFPNLPYLIDGDFKLTESAAIVKYIIKKSGKTELLGKTPEDEAKIDNIIGVINDGLKDIRGLYWNKDYANVKIEVLEKARPKFNYIKEFVGDKQWALGYLTLVDFILAEMLAYFQTLYPSEYKHYSFWWRIKHNFDELPEVQKYYERADAVHGPYSPPYAALQPVSKRIKLGYWGIRGKAQVIRLLLSFSKQDFQDVVYTSPEKWFQEDKLHLGIDFPNLPYLINGPFKLSEAAAIQRYVINKWGNKELLGKNPHDEAQIDSFLSIFQEIGGATTGLFFNKDHQTAKPEVIKKYASKLEVLNKFVGEKNFALGYLTLIDFIVAEYSHYIETVFPEEYKAYPFLGRIRAHFDNLPETKAYYESENAFKGRFLPPTAFYSVEK